MSDIFFVIPAQAGIQLFNKTHAVGRQLDFVCYAGQLNPLDSRLRGNDKNEARILAPTPSFPRRRESSRIPAMQPVVYILASQRNGTLYTGVTSDLFKRTWEHRNDVAEGFSKRYRVHLLVYFEFHSDMLSAITREKQIKKWNRAWKIRLIESINPEWQDLWNEII